VEYVHIYIYRNHFNYGPISPKGQAIGAILKFLEALGLLEGAFYVFTYIFEPNCYVKSVFE